MAQTGDAWALIRASVAAQPSGCVFHTRCLRKLGEICEQHDPLFLDAGADHRIRCHIPLADLRALQGDTHHHA
ncbi:hypothetical protein FNZ07_29455 [Paraburkholderia megapolitana]|nr:hypothetical protein FNZ07_29455 [Paraburkholderia megapolitana]